MNGYAILIITSMELHLFRDLVNSLNFATIVSTHYKEVSGF